MTIDFRILQLGSVKPLQGQPGQTSSLLSCCKTTWILCSWSRNHSGIWGWYCGGWWGGVVVICSDHKAQPRFGTIFCLWFQIYCGHCVLLEAWENLLWNYPIHHPTTSKKKCCTTPVRTILVLPQSCIVLIVIIPHTIFQRLPKIRALGFAYIFGMNTKFENTIQKK